MFSIMAKYSDIFVSFFKIGTFTIGGGYAMIPLMQNLVVEKHKWMGEEEFMDMISLSQAMPGVFAVNMASSVGYRLRGVKGAAVAVVGNIVAPIAIILLLAVFFRHFSDNRTVAAIFRGIRPAVVALIASPVFSMAKTAKISWRNVWIPVLSALLISLFGVSPVAVILVAGLAGFVYGKIRNREGGKA